MFGSAFFASFILCMQLYVHIYASSRTTSTTSRRAGSCPGENRSSFFLKNALFNCCAALALGLGLAARRLGGLWPRGLVVPRPDNLAKVPPFDVCLKPLHVSSLCCICSAIPRLEAGFWASGGTLAKWDGCPKARRPGQSSPTLRYVA